MAIKRPGKKEQSNGKAPPHITDTEDQIYKIKKERKEQKDQILRERRRSDIVRWVMIGVLVLITVATLYYYSSTLNSEVGAPATRTAKHASAEPKSPQGIKGSKKKQAKKKTGEGKANAKINDSPKEAEADIKVRILQKPFSPDDPDKPYTIEILHGDNLLSKDEYTLALQVFNDIIKKFPQSPRALLGKAKTLAKMAEEKKSNKLMDTAIDFYKKAGLEGFIGDADIRIAALVELADRAHERGKAGVSIKALEKLVSLKDDNDLFSNRLGLGYISDGKLKKAKLHFENHLEKFPGDHFANAQLGYILYTDRRYEQALSLLLDGIRNDKGVKVNPKFYQYAGNCLTKLNRTEESYILFSEAVNLKLFPSIWQRPLYYEPNLRAMGWWEAKHTGYTSNINTIQKALKSIREEVKSVFDPVSFSFSSNGISHSKHYILFLNGKKNSNNCLKASKTCALIETFPEAAHCRRGNVKFSFIPPKTHIPSFVGLTNTKLQILVAVDIASEETISLRVAEEKKTLKSGDVVVIDESFEQEIWNPSNEAALFLLIDVWHPDLTAKQMKRLGPLV